MNPLRLIIDPPQDGAWNMAVDEALLESAIGGGVATLRFYGWSEPTLSLGYFQAYADRESHTASRNCPCVRRHSGGGAILHDHELTYSLTLPPDSPLVRDPELLYRRVHESFLAAMDDVAPGATPANAIRLCDVAVNRGGEEPFLCFQRRAKCDVLVDAGDTAEAAKVCGSAQRKRRGAILQHGSVLLRRSDSAPELLGLKELIDAPAAADSSNNLRQAWCDQLVDKLGLAFDQAKLTAEECDAARNLAASRFGAAGWTQRR